MKNSQIILVSLGIVFVLIFSSACDKSDNSSIAGIPGNDTYFTFSLVSPDGIDLLDSSSEGYIDPTKIEFFEEIDGKFEYLYDRLLDNPNGIGYSNESGSNLLSLTNNSLLFKETPGATRFILDWKTYEPDTLTIHLVKGDGSLLYIDQVEQNDTTVWSTGDNGGDAGGERTFSMVVE